MSKSKKRYSYVGFRVRQRLDGAAVETFTFQAPVSEVAKWAGVRNVEASPTGAQRVEKPPRSRAITRFFGADVINTIPTSILVAFPKRRAKFTPADLEALDADNGCETLEFGSLSFASSVNAHDHQRAALIVDGQHRVKGMAAFEDEDLPVLVVALLNASTEEQAFQFVVINNKSAKVPTDNVKAIVARFDEDELRDRLTRSGIPYGEMSPLHLTLNEADDSPFEQLLDWPLTKDKSKRLVSLTAVEHCFRYTRATFPETFDDDDSILWLFTTVFAEVASLYEDLWGKEGTLMKKVVLTAIYEFVLDRLRPAWELDAVDVLESTQVRKLTGDALRGCPVAFWVSEWSVPIQDNANVRKLLKSDLKTMAGNRKRSSDWDEDLVLVK